jgi:hypothetical protein
MEHSRNISYICLNSPKGLGSIGEVWQDQGRWAEFKMYLANLNEGEDSEGVPIMLDRYRNITKYCRLCLLVRYRPISSLLERKEPHFSSPRRGKIPQKSFNENYS